MYDASPVLTSTKILLINLSSGSWIMMCLAIDVLHFSYLNLVELVYIGSDV